MTDLPSGVLLFIVLCAAAAPLSILYTLACAVRNQTSVHDLKMRVGRLRDDYDRRLRDMKGENEPTIIAEVVPDQAAAVTAQQARSVA